MDGTNLDFASEMLSAFGEDRFYHAMERAGLGGCGLSIFKSRGGDEEGWRRMRGELRLKGDALLNVQPHYHSDDDMREILCKVAFTISKHHKEFALRSPKLPPSIHARMLLDVQNEWTRKYADNVSPREEQI